MEWNGMEWNENKKKIVPDPKRNKTEQKKNIQ